MNDLAEVLRSRQRSAVVRASFTALTSFEMRLLGLEHMAGESDQNGRIVVVGGTSAEYIGALKTLAMRTADSA